MGLYWFIRENIIKYYPIFSNNLNSISLYKTTFDCLFKFIII